MYFDTAVPFPGNYPMDIFTHKTYKDICCSVACICNKTEIHLNAHQQVTATL